jgi:hypothetical protein
LKNRTFFAGILSAIVFVVASQGIVLLILIYSGGKGSHGTFNGIRNAYIAFIASAVITFVLAGISFILRKAPFFKGILYILSAAIIAGLLLFSFVTRQ